MKKISVGLMVTLFMVIASGCAINSPGASQELVGITWYLHSFDSQPPLENTSVTLEFADGKISGISGCNHYGGSYQVKGETITFNDIYATEMFCVDPAGVMDQEQSYLSALQAASSYNITSGVLTIATTQGQTLTFETQPIASAPTVLPTNTVASTQPVITLTATPEPLVDNPTVTPVPVADPPDDFVEYKDALTGISIYIPDNWIVTGVVDGQYAIFQSYPEDKYVGGEGLELGDTKCDLNIRPEGVQMTGYLQQLEAAPTVSIVSEQEITLQSGALGMRLEIDSLGRSVLFVTELSHRTVVLNCFGDFTKVDEIAVTLSAID